MRDLYATTGADLGGTVVDPATRYVKNHLSKDILLPLNPWVLCLVRWMSW